MNLNDESSLVNQTVILIIIREIKSKTNLFVTKNDFKHLLSLAAKFLCLLTAKF